MKRVLIIDDDCLNEEDSIREGFAGTGIEVILCPTKEAGSEWINSKALFDCIVLDWYLEDTESPILSKQILKELENRYYAPVMIYSSHSANFKAEQDAGAITYPKNLIHEVQKGNFLDISERVNTWLSQNYTAKLSTIYLERVYEAIHKTFFNLNSIPHGNIAGVYKSLVFENGNIDWGNDFVINQLLQNIVSDEQFRTNISSLVNDLQQEALETSAEERTKVAGNILYFTSVSPFLANGDVFKISCGDRSCFGLITTPDCDLSQKNTRYIEFIELIKIGATNLGNASSIKENKGASHFFLPGVKETKTETIDLVAVFKANHFLTAKGNQSDRYPAVNNRIRYDDPFIYLNADCKITYICSIVNPYKSELFHKKNSHDSRIGIPTIYEYIKGAN